MSGIEVVSIAVGILSMGLAIFAIWQSDSSRRETQANSTRIGEVLKEIEANSSMIKEYVTRSQQDMRDYIVGTQKDLLESQRGITAVFTKQLEAQIPTRVTADEELWKLFVTQLFSRPESIGKVLEVVQAMQQTAQKLEESEQRAPSQGSEATTSPKGSQESGTKQAERLAPNGEQTGQ